VRATLEPAIRREMAVESWRSWRAERYSPGAQSPEAATRSAPELATPYDRVPPAARRFREARRRTPARTPGPPHPRTPRCRCRRVVLEADRPRRDRPRPYRTPTRRRRPARRHSAAAPTPPTRSRPSAHSWTPRSTAQPHGREARLPAARRGCRRSDRLRRSASRARRRSTDRLPSRRRRTTRRPTRAPRLPRSAAPRPARRHRRSRVRGTGPPVGRIVLEKRCIRREIHPRAVAGDGGPAGASLDRRGQLHDRPARQVQREQLRVPSGFVPRGSPDEEYTTRSPVAAMSGPRDSNTGSPVNRSRPVPSVAHTPDLEAEIGVASVEIGVRLEHHPSSRRVDPPAAADRVERAGSQLHGRPPPIATANSSREASALPPIGSASASYTTTAPPAATTALPTEVLVAPAVSLRQTRAVDVDAEHLRRAVGVSTVGSALDTNTVVCASAAIDGDDGLPEPGL